VVPLEKPHPHDDAACVLGIDMETAALCTVAGVRAGCRRAVGELTMAMTIVRIFPDTLR
jgi:uridine phosphorylase